MRTVRLAGGRTVPALGLGTWRMGERGDMRAQEVKALQLGIDLGLTLIDTAEMYGEGGAEEVVGEAIAGRRDEVYVVTKVYPHNASRDGVIAACDRSLRRLGTEHIDLYLLHWRGQYPLAETVDAFETLKADGRIGQWGVSNFDVGDMDELMRIAPSGTCAANQVLYNLRIRGIEWELIGKCQTADVAVMAYTPLGEGPMLDSPMLGDLAAKYEVEPATVALAWILRHEGMIAIPKAADPDHVRANAAAAALELDADDLAFLDEAFPPPNGPTRLAII